MGGKKPLKIKLMTIVIFHHTPVKTDNLSQQHAGVNVIAKGRNIL